MIKWNQLKEKEKMNLSLNELLTFLKSKGVTIVFITDKRKNSMVFNGSIKKGYYIC